MVNNINDWQEVPLYNLSTQSGKNRAIMDLYSDQPEIDDWQEMPMTAAPKPINGDDKGAFTSFVQGVNSVVPFGNRITAAAASAALSPFTDLTFSELYDTARANQKATEEASPMANLAGSIGGIAATLPIGLAKTAASTPILGTAANALNKGSQATANFIRGSALSKDAGLLAKAASLGGRAARGAAVAAPTAAVYQYGASDKDGWTNPERAADTMEAAGMGAAFGAALPAVGAALGASIKGGKNIYKGTTARSVEQLDDALSSIKERSSQAYQTMRDAGAIINKPRAINIANRVEAAVKSSGALNPRLHSTTIGLLDDFQQATRSGEMSLDDLDKWRQTFGQVAGNFNDKLNQRNASIAIEAIDDAVDGLKKIDIRGGKTEAIDALNMGRQEWARARKFETVADVVRKSEGDANYVKRELKKILDNPKKSRGFTKDEIDALREASRLTTGEGILKSLGKFGFDLGAPSRIGNTALPTIGTVLAGSSGGLGVGAAVPIAGTLARSGQKALARGKAENLLNVIEGISKQTVSPAQREALIRKAMSLPPAQARQFLNSLPALGVTTTNINQ